MLTDSPKSIVVVKNNPCQICSWKGHGTMNCYNRFYIAHFPLTHDHKLLVVGIPRGALTNVFCANNDHATYFGTPIKLPQLTYQVIQIILCHLSFNLDSHLLQLEMVRT